jgi:hypothetical protein
MTLKLHATEVELRRMVDEGMTPQGIACYLGCSVAYIRAALGVLGIGTHKRSKNEKDTAEQIASVLSRMERGHSVVSIARDLGVPSSTLYFRLKRGGYPTTRFAALHRHMQTKDKA